MIKAQNIQYHIFYERSGDMKKFFKVLSIVLVVLIGGCAFVSCVAVDEVATEVQEESDTQSDIVEQVTQNLEWEFVPDGYGYGTLETVLTNTTDTKIDYVQFDVKFIKDGVTESTDFTNEVDIQPGESRKVQFVLVKDDFDSYEITVSSSALD